MALDYWSVGNPDSRIRRSLESQFSEAMADIRLGFSYQDAGTVLYINPYSAKKKMHLKMLSAEVVCCKYLPNITDESSIEANSVDPEQTAPIGAV